MNLLLEIEKTKLILDYTIFSSSKPYIVVGIPAFNEEKTISNVIFTAQNFADAIIVCDDGSMDQTTQVAKCSGADVIKHKRNRGYGAAIGSLFKRARRLNADVLVTIDSDGQHDPKEIPNIVKPIVEGVADMVIGSRFINANGTVEMPLYRRFGAKLITKLVNGSSKNGIHDSQSGFRAYNREALKHLQISESGMGASVEILFKAHAHNLKICEVPSYCKYPYGMSTSTKNPITHGISIIIYIARFIVKKTLLKFT